MGPCFRRDDSRGVGATSSVRSACGGGSGWGKRIGDGSSYRLSVGPANAGTHTPRSFKWATEPAPRENNRLRWLWVPAFAGTTRGEWVPRARCAPSPALAGEGRGGGKPQTTVFVGKRL